MAPGSGIGAAGTAWRMTEATLTKTLGGEHAIRGGRWSKVMEEFAPDPQGAASEETEGVRIGVAGIQLAVAGERQHMRRRRSGGGS